MTPTTPIMINDDGSVSAPSVSPVSNSSNSVTTVFSQKPKPGFIGEEKVLLSAQGINFYSEEFASTFANFMHDCGQCKMVRKFMTSHINCADNYKVLYNAAHACTECRYNIAIKDMVDIMVELEDLSTVNRKGAKHMAKVIDDCFQQISREAKRVGIQVTTPFDDDVEQTGIRRWKYKLDDSPAIIID